jgi:hypothetical protein
MGQPTDVTEIGQQAYNAVAPLAEEDSKKGWALLRYMDALVSQAQQVRDQVRDRSPKELGYSILMDVTRSPAYALEWLSQFAGVDLSKLRRGLNIIFRNECNNPSFEYDTLGSEPAAWEKANAAGITATAAVVSNTWAAIGAKALKYTGKKANNVTLEEMGVQQKTGAANYTSVEPGKWFNVQLKLNAIKNSGEGYFITVTWYQADGTTVISSISTAATVSTGVFALLASFEAPAKAAFARVKVWTQSKTALQEIEFFVDEVMTYLTAAKQLAALPYVDGDQTGCQWVGTPGNSDSIQVTEQTEEEFNELKRSRIEELPATRRGKPDAIVKAVQSYLIGDKTVLLQERPGGNPWRLVVVTFSEETPNEALIREVLEEYVPAGIVVEYTAVPANNWLVIRTEYATWKAVKEAFVTWGGVRLDKPGT